METLCWGEVAKHKSVNRGQVGFSVLVINTVKLGCQALPLRRQTIFNAALLTLGMKWDPLRLREACQWD